MNPADSPTRQALLDALQAAGRIGVRASEFAAQRGIQKGGVNRLLRKLEARELVVKCGKFGDPDTRWIHADVLRKGQAPNQHAWPWDDRGRSALTRADVVEGIRQADVIAPVPWG